MGVRESLVLDHFYFNVSSEEFDSLLRLKNLFGACSHQKLEVVGDSWEGVYLHSRPQSYLEILREQYNLGFFGLCLSPIKPILCDAAKIVEEMPANWRIHNQTFETGEPWFDAYSTTPLPDGKQLLFEPWIMRYHQTHFPYLAVTKPRSVDRFSRIHFSLGADHASALPDLLSWLPIPGEFSSGSIKLKIPDRDGFIFNVDIDLVSGSSRFDLHSLEMEHCDPTRFNDFSKEDLGAFELTKHQNTLILARK